jgi:hypothetical protein
MESGKEGVMEGQELRAQLGKIDSPVADALRAMSPSAADRPPALPWSVDRLEKETIALAEVSLQTVDRLRLISTEEYHEPQPGDEMMKKIPERTGVAVADRILELVESVEVSRRRIEAALSRVAL